MSTKKSIFPLISFHESSTHEFIFSPFKSHFYCHCLGLWTKCLLLTASHLTEIYFISVSRNVSISPFQGLLRDHITFIDSLHSSISEKLNYFWSGFIFIFSSQHQNHLDQIDSLHPLWPSGNLLMKFEHFNVYVSFSMFSKCISCIEFNLGVLLEMLPQRPYSMWHHTPELLIIWPALLVLSYFPVFL